MATIKATTTRHLQLVNYEFGVRLKSVCLEKYVVDTMLYRNRLTGIVDTNPNQYTPQERESEYNRGRI